MNEMRRNVNFNNKYQKYKKIISQKGDCFLDRTIKEEIAKNRTEVSEVCLDTNNTGATLRTEKHLLKMHDQMSIQTPFY